MKIKKIISVALMIIALASCIIMLVTLMDGETKISGQKPEDIEGKVLICESQNMRYPFADYDKSEGKNLKTTVNFYGDEIKAIYLIYTLYYNNEQQIVASEASNHADMNISFGKNGLKADALNARYSKMKDFMRISLYAIKDDLNSVTARYFMIESNDQMHLPTTLLEYKENYEKQGFICQSEG